MNRIPCWLLDNYELREMPTPNLDGLTAEKIGPTTNFEEMSEESYANWHEAPLSREAEEMLLAYESDEFDMIFPGLRDASSYARPSMDLLKSTLASRDEA